MAKTNTKVKPKSKAKATMPEQPIETPSEPVEGATPSEPEVAEEEAIVSNVQVPDEIQNTMVETLSQTPPKASEFIIHISHSELFPFKEHPFQLRDDEDMRALIASVKERGVDQPAIVRPRENGGFELIMGHRRQFAAAAAGYSKVPCVIREMTDEEAVLAMTESNFNQRSDILASERAKALKMQLDAIKRQGVRNGDKNNPELNKRSNEVVAERNRMSVKNVQRYIALNNLIPELLQCVDDKKMKFIAAVDSRRVHTSQLCCVDPVRYAQIYCRYGNHQRAYS